MPIRFRSLLFLVGLALSQADFASAAIFEVEPTRVILSERASQIITLTNRGAEPARLQIEVQAWSQSAAGEMLLEPSKEIVYFPRLTEIPPGEARIIRIGFTGKREAGGQKAYRIFFSELPPEEAVSGTTVRVLTRMGVPVFVGPENPKIAARLADLSMSDSKFHFSFVNDGNTFTMIRDAKLIGMDEAGNPLFEKQISGWYVLAGGRRDYSVPLEVSDCEDLRKIAVVLTHGVDDRVALEAELPAECPTDSSPRSRGQASSDQ